MVVVRALQDLIKARSADAQLDGFVITYRVDTRGDKLPDRPGLPDWAGQPETERRRSAIVWTETQATPPPPRLPTLPSLSALRLSMFDSTAGSLRAEEVPEPAVPFGELVGVVPFARRSTTMAGNEQLVLADKIVALAQAERALGGSGLLQP